MKIKTKDKITFLVKKSNEKANYWKKVAKDFPKDFEKVFQEIKNGGSVKITNGILNLEPKLPSYIGIDFSKFSSNEKADHEKFIKKSAGELLRYIKEFNLVGACMTLPYFYKLFLEDHNIPVDVEFGVFELDGRFSAHSWNSYDGKIIDLTSALQKWDITGDAIVLGNIIEKGKDSLLYHRADKLPKKYIDFISEIAIKEKEIIDKRLEDSSLDYYKEMLVTDAFLCKALRDNMNSSKTIEKELLPNNQDEIKHFKEYFVTKF